MAVWAQCNMGNDDKVFEIVGVQILIEPRMGMDLTYQPPKTALFIHKQK